MFPRSNRETLLDGALIIQLTQAVMEIAITGGYGVVIIGANERSQSVQDRRRLICLQSLFLHVQPRPRMIGGTDLGRFAQILTHMEEIDPK